MCAYLLDEVEWPDHQDELRVALCIATTQFTSESDYKTPTEGSIPERMYRLFIEKHGLDVDINWDDLDDNKYRPRSWWNQCPSKICRDIIIQNMSLPWSTHTVEERFALVSAQSSWSPTADEFLNLIGIDLDDPAIHTLRGYACQSVLHYIGGAIYIAEQQSLDPFSAHRARDWVQLGSKVLRTCPNPHVQAVNPFFETKIMAYSTPFLASISDLLYSDLEDDNILVTMLCRWSDMITNAGLDLSCFAQKENAILLELEHESGSDTKSFEVAGIELSGHPTKADIKIQYIDWVCVHQLTRPPGDFPTDSLLPTTISWQPSDSERDEGHWIQTRQFKLTSELIGADVIETWHNEPFVDLIDQTQDDAGPLILMVDRSTRRKSPRMRSHSSPPSIYRREGAHILGSKDSRHGWLPRFSLSVQDMTYRFTQRSYSPRDNFTPILDLREGIQTHQCDIGVIHNSARWKYESFLADMYDCKTSPGLHWHHARSRGHTFAPDCPQGCGELPWAWKRLQVPKELLAGHPGLNG